MIYGVAVLGGMLAVALATGIRRRGGRAAPTAAGLFATALLCVPARFLGLFLGAGNQVALVSLSLLVVFLVGWCGERLGRYSDAEHAGGQTQPGGCIAPGS
jgi:hypothetical protein